MLVWLLYVCLVGVLTSVGPVLASLHSTADSLITILGSSHATAKYIEITIDCNQDVRNSSACRHIQDRKNINIIIKGR